MSKKYIFGPAILKLAKKHYYFSSHNNLANTMTHRGIVNSRVMSHAVPNEAFERLEKEFPELAIQQADFNASRIERIYRATGINPEEVVTALDDLAINLAWRGEGYQTPGSEELHTLIGYLPKSYVNKLLDKGTHNLDGDDFDEFFSHLERVILREFPDDIYGWCAFPEQVSVYSQAC